MSAPTRSTVLRDAIGLGLAVGLYGAAFGAAADAAGLNLWQAMTLSALMFTGASQFALDRRAGCRRRRRGRGRQRAAAGHPQHRLRRPARAAAQAGGRRPPARHRALGDRRDDGAVHRGPRPGAGAAGLPRRRCVDLPHLERHDGRGRARGGRAHRPRARRPRRRRPRRVPGVAVAAAAEGLPGGGGAASGGAGRRRDRAGADALRPRRRAGDRRRRGGRARRAATGARRCRRDGDGALGDGPRRLARLLPAEARRSVGAGRLGRAAVGGPVRRLRAGRAAGRPGGCPGVHQWPVPRRGRPPGRASGGRPRAGVPGAVHRRPGAGRGGGGARPTSSPADRAVEGGAARQNNRSPRCSRSSRNRLRGNPPPKPTRLPSAPITRWHGTTTASGLRPLAAPTA